MSMNIQFVYEKVLNYKRLNRGLCPDFINFNHGDFHDLVDEVRASFSTVMDTEYKTFLGIRVFTSTQLNRGEVVLSNDNQVRDGNV